MNKILYGRTILLSLLLAFGMCSCTVFSERSDNDATHYFSLAQIPKAMIGQSRLEKFEFFSVVNRSMLVQSELTATHINIVAMTFEGLPIIQASWQALDNQWQVITGISLPLEPSQILHDLQSVHWPVLMLENVLFEHYSIVESVNDVGDRSRHFYFNDELIRTIDYKKDMIEFNDFRKNYQLKITPLTSGKT